MRKCEHILVETDSRVTASGSEPVQAAPVVYLSAMTSNQGRPARQKATFLPVQIFFSLLSLPLSSLLGLFFQSSLGQCAWLVLNVPELFFPRLAYVIC